MLTQSIAAPFLDGSRQLERLSCVLSAHTKAQERTLTLLTASMLASVTATLRKLKFRQEVCMRFVMCMIRSKLLNASVSVLNDTRSRGHLHMYL